MRFIIMLIISLFFTPTVISNNYDNNASTMAKERSAELIVSAVRTAYAASIMRNSGMEPTIDDINSSIELENADVTTTKDTIKITTDNNITCIFTIEKDKLKLSNSCNGFYKDTNVEIGKVSTK